MTKLEFIDQEIKFTKQNLNNYKNMFKTHPHLPEIASAIKQLKEKLQILQQIKTDLEVWEVVKDKISITVYYDNEQDYEEDINSHNAICLNSNLRLQNANNEEEWFVPLTDEESEKFKKVLEVRQ